MGNMDPTLSVATTLSLGVVTSWGLASSFWAFWEIGKRFGRQVGVQLLWYASLGTLTFALVKHVEEVVRVHMEEWIAYGYWAKNTAEMWQGAAASWLDVNWYPALATLAVSLLVALQCVARSVLSRLSPNDVRSMSTLKGRPPKMQPSWSLPGRIVKVYPGGQRGVIKDLLSGKTKDVHISDIRLVDPPQDARQRALWEQSIENEFGSAFDEKRRAAVVDRFWEEVQGPAKKLRD